MSKFQLIVRAVSFIIILLIGLVGFVGVSAFWYTDIRPVFAGAPVVDPDDPNFDSSAFRFEYYSKRFGTRQLLMPVFLKMFPPGTSKDMIDAVLIDQLGSASAPSHPDFATPGGFRYQWPDPKGYFGLNSLSGHVIILIYDDGNRSIGLNLNGARLYGKESEASKEELTPEMRATLERILRPMRKKYIGNEGGFL